MAQSLRLLGDGVSPYLLTRQSPHTLYKSKTKHEIIEYLTLVWSVSLYNSFYLLSAHIKQHWKKPIQQQQKKIAYCGPTYFKFNARLQHFLNYTSFQESKYTKNPWRDLSTFILKTKHTPLGCLNPICKATRACFHLIFSLLISSATLRRLVERNERFMSGATPYFCFQSCMPFSSFCERILV
jgi:hypothetical protein